MYISSLPLRAIELECSKLCELLSAHVHSRLTIQSYQPNEPLIKSTATPASAIRQKLQKSLTRGRHETTIARAVSSESLSELLLSSQPSHVNCSVVWEQDIADSLLANLPSQLSEECEVTVDNITCIEDSTTSHTDSSSPKEKRVTRRRTCHRQSLAPSQVSASSRRKKQKKSVRSSTINAKRQSLQTRTRKRKKSF